MKKITGSLILAMALFSLSLSTVQADELSISLGLKARFENDSVEFPDGSEDSTLLLGASLKLSYGDFFGGVSWLQTIDRYSVDFFSFTANEEGNIDISMSDLDALVGYMVHPRVGILVGYKSYTGRSTPGFTQRFDLSIKGPAVGLAYNYPLKESPWLFIANVSYMPSLEYSFLEGRRDLEQDMDGYSVEIGMTYGSMEKIAYTVGVKHQELISDLGDDWRYLGLTISVDYRF
jgi:hypothetical protein